MSADTPVHALEGEFSMCEAIYQVQAACLGIGIYTARSAVTRWQTPTTRQFLPPRHCEERSDVAIHAAEPSPEALGQGGTAVWIATGLRPSQ
jgi:hypothetical protein